MCPKLLILLTAGVFVLSGCGSQNRIVNKYYLIEKPDAPEFSLDLQQPCINEYCQISPVEISPAFGTQKIAIRRNSHEIVYYSYHHWAERPDVFLTAVMEDFYSHVPVFKGISTHLRDSVPVFTIVSFIDKLEVLESDKSMSAHLSLEFRLSDEVRKETILLHSADRTQILVNNDLNLFAAAIGKMFYDELSDFSTRIIEHFTDTTNN